MRRGLDRETILRAALGIVDEGGLSALTMRALGERLGVDPMATYRHIPNKRELLDGVDDLVLAEVELPASSAPWDEQLRALATSTRAVIRAHPALAVRIAAEPPVGPNGLRVAERLLEILMDAGFEATEAVRHAQVVIAVVLGSVVTGRSDDPDHATNRMARVRAAFAAAPDGSHPLVRRAAETIDAEDGDVGNFGLALDLLVDALGRQVDRLAAGSG